MTKDQKQTLYIVGGVAVIAVLWWLTQRGQIAEAPAVEANPYVPSYVDYNVPPINVPAGLPPSSLNLPRSNRDMGCGCDSGNDGCFTSNIESGQNPVSLAQAMQVYQSQDPDTYRRLVDQLGVYRISM